MDTQYYLTGVQSERKLRTIIIRFIRLLSITRVSKVPYAAAYCSEVILPRRAANSFFCVRTGIILGSVRIRITFLTLTLAIVTLIAVRTLAGARARVDKALLLLLLNGWTVALALDKVDD